MRLPKAIYIIGVIMMLGVSPTLSGQNLPSNAINPKFAWGADLGSSVDLSGNDMSSVNIDAYLGYRHGYMQLLGVGASLNMMVSNSNRSFPIYAIMRTNFQTSPSLCFIEGRWGASINYLEYNHTQTGFYSSVGVGFNLATGSTFSSHLIVGYEYLDRGYFIHEEQVVPHADLHLATIRLGISF